jgi:hypothetical protein
MDSRAGEIRSLLWAIALLENGKTQMRRMEKDAARAWIRAGGPLSKPHSAVNPGFRNSEVRSNATAAVWTPVTRGTTFLEVFRRSAVTQAVSHDRETVTKLIAATVELSMAE